MGIYRLSDMVRIRREALGMTQEKLIEIPDENGEGSHEICSIDTLRRIERGKVARAKDDVYGKLMTRFHTLPERVYASLFVTDSKALDLKSEIQMHMCLGEYDQAGKKLEKQESMLIPDYLRNQQYLMERKATLAYRQGGLEAEKYLGILLDALRLTVPVLDQVEIDKWPFNEEEFNILFGIANVYHAMKERDKELELLLKIKKNMEKKYMDQEYYVVWKMHASIGISQLMCMENKCEESIEYCVKEIEECREWGILGSVHRFLYDLAWSREQQIKQRPLNDKESLEEQELLIEKERASCKRQLVQAYYLSKAQGQLREAERVKRLYEAFYPGEAKLP